MFNVMGKAYGQIAVDSGLNLLKRFSELDLSPIEAACEALSKVYPNEIAEYYKIFIERRIEICKQYIAEKTSGC